jgi:hypothetical protein
MNNNEVHYLFLCRNNTQGNTLKIVKQHRMEGRGGEEQWRRVTLT